MKNKEDSISANEISKFCYCPYQWYYQKIYGQTYLKKEHSKKLKELGLTDVTQSNLKKGLDFHSVFKFKSRFKFKFLTILFLIIFILALIYKLWFF